jgi:GNAT superfamily N-acetyltransferase
MSNAAGVVGRLRRAEAEDAAAVAEVMRLDGNDAAGVEMLGDGALVALGPGRYVNRAIGVGPDLDDGDVEAIERFFSCRGLPASVELTSWASDATLDRLAARGYRPQWFRSVFAAALPGPDVSPRPDGIEVVEVVEVDDRNLDEWLEVFAEGNEVASAAERAVSDEFGRAAHRTPGAVDLLATVDGRAVGCGSLRMASGVGLLGGAATRSGHRGVGVQSALLRHRIRLAAEQGCDLIAATALPAGVSARNLQRHGLQLVDTQLAMTTDGVRPVH